MNDYTLILFKLTHLNINIEKYFESIMNEDEIYLNLSTFICPQCISKDIKIISSVTSKFNYTIFVVHKTTIVHRRKFQCLACKKFFLKVNPIVSYNLNISF